jgi:hypothetical protein
MLLGFKRQFAPFVENGSKTHTIRGRGKRRRFEPGDSCDCYVDPRQRSMRLLGRFPCIAVEDIEIRQTGIASRPLIVWIDGDVLSPDEADQLFHRDGFREITGESNGHMIQAAEFWGGAKFPFFGDLIHWEFR